MRLAVQYPNRHGCKLKPFGRLPCPVERVKIFFLIIFVFIFGTNTPLLGKVNTVPRDFCTLTLLAFSKYCTQNGMLEYNIQKRFCLSGKHNHMLSSCSLSVNYISLSDEFDSLIVAAEKSMNQDKVTALISRDY